MHAKPEHSPPTFNAEYKQWIWDATEDSSTIVSYIEHVTIQEVRNKINHAINPYEELVTKVLVLKWKFYMYNKLFI